jgi:L-2-hydroxyglutarate oxidase LhgO
MSVEKVDIIIVGGGVLGLSSGVALLKRNSNLSVAILEQENFVGDHCSSRNSEVLHAGFYYPENSEKHLHCVEGNRLWREYIKHHGISLMESGKFVVARKEEETEFFTLFEKAKKMTSGISLASANELLELKKITNCEFAFFSSSTAVLSAGELLQSLKNEFEKLGGILLLNNKVEEVTRLQDCFELIVNNEKIFCDILVNTAGFGAVELRGKLLKSNEYQNYWVKGRYLSLNKKLNFKTLVYPIPPRDLMGLGVHLTLSLDGQMKFGPDTQEITSIDYSLNENLIDEMYPQIKKLFFTVEKSDLRLGYAGIRPKLKRTGELMTDFVFQTSREHGVENYFEFLGVESPGLTAALSLAKKLVKTIF